MALIQVEVVDREGKRCPLDNRIIKFDLKGEAEWRGGIAQGENNYILSKNLPVECGINRVFVRSTTKAGKIILTAKAKGLPDASVLLETIPVTIKDGLGTYLPQYTLKGRFDKVKHLELHLIKIQKKKYALFLPKRVLIHKM